MKNLILIFVCLLTSCALSAAEFLLAQTARLDIDPAGFLVSEKFDGVRAQWNGRELILRSGAIASAPASFIENLPELERGVSLDGELWLGYGRFEELSGLVRSADADWTHVKFLIFEMPGAGGSFAERADKIQRVVSRHQQPNLIAVPQRRVATNAELRKLLAEVEARGGEGLMLHRADASEQTGRSDALLKYKSFDDAEATVLAYSPGKGQFTGLMGALHVRDGRGQQFKIGSGFSKAQRAEPPAIGSRVTFRFQGYTRTGKPRFARFLRVRTDR
jgi:DNA ligase 1